MAAGTVLKCNFKDASGNDLSFRFNHADSTKAANVRAAMEGMIVNGDIYSPAPAAIDSALFITTTETPVSL